MNGKRKGGGEEEIHELVDRLLEGRTPEEIMGGGGPLDEMTKRVMARALEGEFSDDVG